MSNDPNDYAQEQYEQMVIDEYMKDLAEGPAHVQMATFGDAVEKRVFECIDEAKRLNAAGFPGAALARSITAIEIIIRHFLVRPLIYAAFSTDEWADVLVDRILQKGPRGSTTERELLPAILRNWGIDITGVVFPSGKHLWQTLKEKPGGLFELRNTYAHQGAICNSEAGNLGVECATSMFSEIVVPLSNRLGLTRTETGCWHVVLSKNDRNLNPPRTWKERSPFLT